MKLLELVTENRSYRSFDESVKIAREDLRELINLARLSASGRNDQCLKFILVHEAEELKKVQETTAWAGFLPDLEIPPKDHMPQAFIVICLDKSIRGDNFLTGVDVGIVAQSITLGAVEKGLGCCMIASFKRARIKEIYSLPEDLEPLLVIALGKADEIVEIVPFEGSTKYYREGEKHIVPKKSVEELIVETKK